MLAYLYIVCKPSSTAIDYIQRLTTHYNYLRVLSIPTNIYTNNPPLCIHTKFLSHYITSWVPFDIAFATVSLIKSSIDRMSSSEDYDRSKDYEEIDGKFLNGLYGLLLFTITGFLMLLYDVPVTKNFSMLFMFLPVCGIIIATYFIIYFIMVGVYFLVGILSKGWRLIVSIMHESGRMVAEGLWKCQRYYLDHSGAVAFIGPTLRKSLTDAVHIGMLVTRDSVRTPRASDWETIHQGCYCRSSVGQGLFIIFSIWWALVAGADLLACLERALFRTQYHSAKFWSVESLMYLALGTYFWPVTFRKACDHDAVVETSVLLILFFCFVAVYIFTIESWPTLGIVNFFRSCIIITKQSWRQLWSVSDTPQDSTNNISQCVHEHDTDPETDPIVLSTCKSICCWQCFNACRDSDQRVYCPQHLALGPQQLHPLRSSHTEWCMCNGDDGLLDTPCGHPVCITCVTRVARGRVQAFGRNRVNGRGTRISETDYHCECCFPLGPDPSPPAVADLLAFRLDDHRPSLIY